MVTGCMSLAHLLGITSYLSCMPVVSQVTMGMIRPSSQLKSSSFGLPYVRMLNMSFVFAAHVSLQNYNHLTPTCIRCSLFPKVFGVTLAWTSCLAYPKLHPDLTPSLWQLTSSQRQNTSFLVRRPWTHLIQPISLSRRLCISMDCHDNCVIS